MIYGLEVLVYFGPKISEYFHYIHCLQKESTHVGVRVLKNFYLKVLVHFESKKSYKKNRKNSVRFLNYIKCSYIIFCHKMFQYLQIIYS